MSGAGCNVGGSRAGVRMYGWVMMVQDGWVVRCDGQGDDGLWGDG